MTSNNKVKNFAIIGAAGYVAVRHMRAIKDTGNKLVVAYDRSDNVGILDSYSHDCEYFLEFERYYDYVNQLSSNPEKKLDFISICTPTYLHHAHITTGMRSGCDIICEKPLVPTPDLLKDLRVVESKTGKRVYGIMQLRFHDAIINLKNKINSTPKDGKYDIELTYITSRGKWYNKSWKGNVQKSFGLVTEIGIHFFDSMIQIFGPIIENRVYYNQPDKATGYVESEKARIRWYLSIDRNDLPDEVRNERPTYRSIKMDGKEIEFSDGFTNLHTKSYEEIFAGNGLGIDEVKPCIELVHDIRNLSISPSDNMTHPFWHKTQS